jgi:hypothetical protein
VKEIHTEINIRTSAKKVWELLTDFQNFKLWNPFIREIEGTPSLGTKIKIHLHTSTGKSRTYQPKITKLEPSKELRWFGKSIIPGFFNGERIFVLEPFEDDHTRFIHKEIFTGILVNLVGNRLDKDMYNSFVSMNEALKKRAEQ